MPASTQDKLVSVIIPVYNADKFLLKSVESVLDQTYSELELILVNDGSTDSSEDQCRHLSNEDSRVKVYSQKNMGPASARNHGLAKASGDYIFFLDADDFIELDAVKILIGANKEDKYDLVMGNFSKLENNGRIVKQSVTFKTGDRAFHDKLKRLDRPEINDYVKHFLKHPSNHLISYCWARLYKNSIIKAHHLRANETMHLFEDFIFNLQYLRVSNSVLFVNSSIYNYVMHNSHVSASMSVLNSNSLLHDMNLFDTEVLNYYTQMGISDEELKLLIREIGHALVHYTIIFIVRSCRNMNNNIKMILYNEIKRLINDPLMIKSLKCYMPAKGNSRVVPLLMRFKMIKLLMMLGHHKAIKRYGEYCDA